MERRPLFPKDEQDRLFYSIRGKVNKLVAELEPKYRGHMLLKAFLYPPLYFGLYGLALAYGRDLAAFYACYAGMGLLLVINFLNLIHDAVHGVLFRSKKANALFVRLFDLMGANSYVWSIRHTRLHHNYPNIMGWDSDVEQSSLARIFPHGPYSRIHKYQHFYLPLIYPFYLLNWLLVRDFKDFFNRRKPVWKVTVIPTREYFILFGFKLFFLFYTVALPKMALGISWGQALAAFLVMLFTASIFSLLVLLSPHANTENEFPLPDANNQLPYSWFMHQLHNTNDLVHDNWFVRWCMGSFNYHVAHHLFPTVSHVYYPAITRLLREEAQRHQWPYRAYPLITTLVNHYRLLKENRRPENIFEEVL
ncbi:fatty acid desaturase family protein [Puia dinghuensis]|uniref:Fatty acid desaturase domain-containing protein n=1 Tax=Puia dinghuensis TaxID=1792502 RepID=A0A8J2UFG3_9BACT|nr:fatty acid desaturase [Puia dinghuensis]GGB09758.1 hypothetical protein GCM10011511_36620 [Puia dinghuensis]